MNLPGLQSKPTSKAYNIPAAAPEQLEGTISGCAGAGDWH